jgi:hypothetical protein
MKKFLVFLCAMFLVFCVFGIANAGLIGISSFAKTGTSKIYNINPSTGEATFIATAGANYTGVGLTFYRGELFASDLMFHIGEPWVVQTAIIDITSAVGVSTAISDQDGGLNWHGLASDESAGLLYTIDIDDNFKLKSMTSDGHITSIGSGTGIAGDGMAFDDTHKILYSVDRWDGNLYKVDTETGVADLIGPLNIGLGWWWYGLAYDEINGVLYGNFCLNPTLNGSLFTIDTLSGNATLVGLNNVDAIEGLAWFPDPFITVTSPNGDEELSASITHEITWTSEGGIEYVTIECSVNGGFDWIEVVARTENNGSYNWEVPCNISDECLIRISDVDSDVSDISDEVFLIIDDSSPSIEISVEKDYLWPPNHNMVDVGLSFEVLDNCDPEPEVSIAVTSDEPTATAPDSVITDDGGVFLRAESSGQGDGRVYVISVTATDASGNSAYSSLSVKVNKSKKKEAIDSGQNYDATDIN